MNERETLFTHLGVVAEEPPQIPAQFRDSQFIFLANTHPAVQLEFLSHFPQRKLAVADTMDLWIKTARPDLENLLKQVDGIVLNYSEAEQLTGVRNADDGLPQDLCELGPKFAVNKKGEHGAILVHQEGVCDDARVPGRVAPGGRSHRRGRQFRRRNSWATLPSTGSHRLRITADRPGMGNRHREFHDRSRSASIAWRRSPRSATSSKRMKQFQKHARASHSHR